MLDLTAPSLLICSGLLTVLTFLGAVFLRFRPGARRRVRELVARGALVLAAQVLAVATVFLAVNNQYDFYASWGDLLGQSAPTEAIVTNGRTAGPVGSGGTSATVAPKPPGHGVGTTRTMAVRDPTSGQSPDTLVWLPPQYSEPTYATARFPVVMFLPGQPSSPKRVFTEYDFAAAASRAIAAGEVKPFVAVFPPLMTQPPRDTECTDVTGGPQALTWLVKDVPAALTTHYRVARPGAAWSVMGWSTGGFCAAKVLLSHPEEFHAAVSFGGYFTPVTDGTTGDLFNGSTTQRQQNSPQWLYQKYGLRGGRLLVVAGKQDTEAWGATTPFLNISQSDPNVSHVSFPLGGHNYRNYRAYLLPALQWLDESGI